MELLAAYHRRAWAGLIDVNHDQHKRVLRAKLFEFRALLRHRQFLLFMA